MKTTRQACFPAALSAMALLFWGCASTAEQDAIQTLKNAGSAQEQRQLGGTIYSRNRLPPLDDGSGLQAYLAYAALNNPQLEAAFNRWKAALEMVPQMRALPDPKFNYGYFIQSVETRVGPQEQRFGISQMFPWFGKLKLRGDAALKDANAAQQKYEAAKLALFDEVKQAFFELYYLGRSISITAENVDLLRQFEKTTRSKYESGTAQYGDVLKAQVELDKLGDRLRTLEDLKRPTVARLNAALNRPPQSPLPFPATISPGKAPPEVGQLVQELRASNPELKDLAFQAEREAAKISLAKLEFFPDLTLGLDYIETGEARTMAPPTVSGGAMPGAPPMTMMMPPVQDSGKEAVMLSVSGNIPLWWEKYRAGVREAESRHAAVQLDRQNRANRLGADLELALFKYRDAERKIALYRDALIPKARENLEAIRTAFEAGKSDFLSLIDTERSLLEFQLNQERATADREQGLATVERLVGGWSSLPTSARPTKPAPQDARAGKR